MRPIQLSMKAFGPYRGQAAPIDFKSFGNGIYVITGETGAGKTSIFDAIMFALYEDVSAKPVNAKENNVESGSSRDKSMLHSDYAPREEDTVVTLRFEQSGKEYTVRRTIHFPASRKNVKSDAKFDAEITGPDFVAIKGSSKVTEKVTEILKMNATEFRQIVMLAQGEFKAFMQARDAQRKEILGGLFDSSPYCAMQKSFAQARIRLEKMSADCQNEIRRALDPSVFYLPGDMDSAERCGFAADHPELTDNIRKLTFQDQSELDKLEQEIQGIQKEINDLNQRRGAAESDNSLLSSLEEARKKEQGLLKEKPAMERLALEKDETGRAWHNGKPAEDRLSKARSELEKTRKSLLQRQSEEEKAAKELEKSKADAARNPERKEQIQQLTARIQKIEEHLGEILELSTASKNEQATDKRLRDASDEKANLDKKITECGQQLEKNTEYLSKLNDIDTTVVQADGALKDTEKTLDALSGRDGLETHVTRALEGKAEAQRTYNASKAAEEKLANADAVYIEKHTAYISTYAKKLGLDIDQDLQNTGTAVCPVCGTVFTSDHPPILQKSDMPVVTDEELQQAEKARDAAQKKLNEISNRLSGLKTGFETEQAYTVELADKLLPEGSPWSLETLQSELKTEIERIRTVKARQEAELTETQKQQKQKKSLEKKQADLTQNLQTLNQQLNDAVSKVSDAKARKEHYTQEVVRLKQALTDAGLISFSSPEDAEKEKSRLNAGRQQLEEACRIADENEKKNREAYSACQARVSEQQTGVTAADENVNRCIQEFQNCIAVSGFATPEAYHSAIARTGGKDGDLWIQEQDKILSRFNTDYAAAQARVQQLEEKTRNLVWTDLSALKAKSDELEKKRGDLNSRNDELKKRANGHRQALDIAEREKDKQVHIASALRRVGNLDAVANGTNGIGGRHSFDGYVLSSAFEEVLAYASKYLSDMTSGKYLLEHDTEAIKASKASFADFRIIVSDQLTGKKREVGSLSGGESFQVSMALALGLSDTVQNHASTVKIETLFIDEGFGSLDSISLQQMLAVLSHLSNGQRQIGIISHVDALEENASRFIRVRRTSDNKGSYLIQEF